MKFLPDVTWPAPSVETSGIAPKDTINSTASSISKQNMVLVGPGGYVRLVLGNDRIGADVTDVIAHGDFMVVRAIWCYAPGTTGIQQLVQVTFNDETIPSGVQRTDYLGLPTQPVDPWLLAAFTAAGKTYTDTLPNIAYSVFKIPASVFTDSNLPNISAIIKGAKFFDPRVGSRVYTENPSVILAGFISDPWGMDQPVNWDSVTVCADEDDLLINGKPRRTLGLTMERPQRTDQWLETLRSYASCWVVPGPDGAELVPDRITASSHTINHYNGDIKSVNSFEFRDLGNTPNVMRITYTDTSEIPWKRDAFAEAMLPSVVSGEARRESPVSMEGFHDYSEALRVAIERLNKLTLTDLMLELVVFDRGITIRVGDVVTVTTDFGITDKLFRVLQVTSAYGDYTLSLCEYDPACYSTAIGTTPTYTDVSLPNPGSPTPPGALTVSEELYTVRAGIIHSRLRITWPKSTFIWLDHYYVEVKQGPNVLWSGNTPLTEFTTGSVQDGVSLTINVFAVSRVGATSVASSKTITTLGKYALPSNVPYIRGYEVGGETRLELGPAIDKDLRGLEVRYGPVGVSWDDAKFVDFVTTAPNVGARLMSKIIPAGVWDVLCCALDSVEQYSAVPARMTLTVTSDLNAFLAERHSFSNPTVTNMVEFNYGPTDSVRRFISDDGIAFGTKFTDPIGDYTDNLATYCTSASTFTTEAWDFGTVLSGDWIGDLYVSNLVGTADEYIDLSDTSVAGPWTGYTPATTRTSGRYARLRSEAAVGDVMLLTIPTLELKINAIPKSEYSKTPVTSSATTYTRITLDNSYVALKGPPKITVLGSVAATATVDNIQTGVVTTFDVYIFSSAGVQIARDFMWEFNGV